MNEKFNKNAKVEKLTKKVGRVVRLIVIGPFGVLRAPNVSTLINLKICWFIESSHFSDTDSVAIEMFICSSYWCNSNYSNSYMPKILFSYSL